MQASARNVLAQRIITSAGHKTSVVAAATAASAATQCRIRELIPRRLVIPFCQAKPNKTTAILRHPQRTRECLDKRAIHLT